MGSGRSTGPAISLVRVSGSNGYCLLRGDCEESPMSGSRPSFNIGIEEEYQSIDPETRDLRSHIQSEILEKGKTLLAERVKPEMHQSVIEIGTGVCENIKAARAEITSIRRAILQLARQNGLRLAAAGAHPFAYWHQQEIYPDDRY